MSRGKGEISWEGPRRVAAHVGEDLGDIAGVGVGLGEQQPHLVHGDPEARADLQQFHADSGALSFGVRGARSN